MFYMCFSNFQWSTGSLKRGTIKELHNKYSATAAVFAIFVLILLIWDFQLKPSSVMTARNSNLI